MRPTYCRANLRHTTPKTPHQTSKTNLKNLTNFPLTDVDSKDCSLLLVVGKFLKPAWKQIHSHELNTIIQVKLPRVRPSGKTSCWSFRVLLVALIEGLKLQAGQRSCGCNIIYGKVPYDLTVFYFCEELADVHEHGSVYLDTWRRTESV